MSFDKTPSLAQVINTALERGFEGLRVSCPGEIQSFDPDRQTAQVKPLVKAWRYDENTGDRVLEPLPIINNVPIRFPAGGGMSFTFPLARGDGCQLVFADRSLAEWIQQGGDAEPAHFWTHHLSDAVAYPAAPPGALPSVDLTALVLGKSDQPADFVALAAKVDAQLNALKAAITGWIPVPNDGGAALKTALTALFTTGVGWPTSVASATVKVKG